MIYTVTLNPALDMISYVKELNTDSFTQTTQSFKYPCGKGINVSRMLYNLGMPSVVTGFLGGYPGDFIRDWFNERGIQDYFIDIEEDNRTTIRIKTDKEEMTIAGISPRIEEEQIEELLYFLSRVREGDIVVMGGSLPKNLPINIYKRISEICTANKASFISDIPAKDMLDGLKDKPLLIKPNIDNLSLMFDEADVITDEEKLIEYGLKCIDLGAQNVIVSIGKEGSYLFTKDKAVYRSYGVEGVEVNSFNSRDAMIAAFIGPYVRKNDPVEAFKMASAAASATAFVEDLASKEQVEEVFKKVKIEQLKEAEVKEEDTFKL
ncbi:MAG: 1-phosphofructokinase family hexose kinase [Tissierellia bacterium]|nr:1-phosphofructokinase family hexose kinase [Tissierellia bacterium]